MNESRAVSIQLIVSRTGSMTRTASLFKTILKCVEKRSSVRAMAQGLLRLTGRIRVGRNNVKRLGSSHSHDIHGHVIFV